MILELVTLGVVGTTALTLLLILCAAWISVPTGSQAVTEYKGEYHRTIASGWHLLCWPLERARSVCWQYMAEDHSGRVGLMQCTGSSIYMGERTYDFPPVAVVTKDRLQVTVNGLVFYQVVNVQKAVYASSDPLTGMQLLITAGIRSALAGMTYENAVEAQASIRNVLFSDSQKILERWGIELLDLRIQSITPSRAILESNELLIKARRAAEAASLQREAERNAQVLAAGTDVDVKRILLEAELKRAQDTAFSEATCMRTRAMAKAEADKLQAESKRQLLTAVGADVMIAEAYSSALREVAHKSGNTLVLPYEAAKAMGGLQIAQTVITAAPRH